MLASTIHFDGNTAPSVMTRNLLADGVIAAARIRHCRDMPWFFLAVRPQAKGTGCLDTRFGAVVDDATPRTNSSVCGARSIR